MVTVYVIENIAIYEQFAYGMLIIVAYVTFFTHWKSLRTSVFKSVIRTNKILMNSMIKLTRPQRNVKLSAIIKSISRYLDISYIEYQ